MTWKITAKFFFDNGQVKKVDWLEYDLYKKGNVGGQDVELPLTKEEVETEFRKLFLKYSNERKTLSVPNIQGELSFIPFEKIYYATVSVSEYSEQEDGVVVVGEGVRIE